KPKASNGLISRWCTHGLVTAPRINVAAVIPSCAPASMMVSSFKERKPARDAREVSAVSSKRLRRALIKENSMMTKKADAIITSRVTTRLKIQLSISAPALRRSVMHPREHHLRLAHGNPRQWILLRWRFLRSAQWPTQKGRGGRFLPRVP